MNRHRLLSVLLAVLVLLACKAFGHAAAAPPGVRELKSRHYRIFTDLDPNLSQDLARRLDAMYETYADRLKGFNSGATEVPRFQVYLFRRQRDYLKLTGERMKNTGGIFMS